MWKRIAIVSVLGSVAVAALMALGDGHPPVHAQAQMPMPGAGASATAPRTNPFSEAWLAAYHGLFDNIWTAEYESRNQAPATSGSLPSLIAPLQPDADVRMSNPSFNTEQNEFQIDINPTNSQYAIGTSNDSLTAGVGIYRTSDGGASWTAFDAPIGTSGCCDPGVAYAYDGSVYVTILRVPPFVTFVIRSTDNGLTWSTPTSVQTNDRPNIVVDNGAGSPRRGTVYLTYTDENASQDGSNRVKGYKSTDNGSSWGPTFFVGDVISSTGFEQGSQPRVASDGTLYVGYQQYTDINVGCGAGVQNTLAKSTDGGVTWTYTVLPITQGGVCTPVQNGRGLFCFSSNGTFRSRSSPIIGVSPTNPQHVYMLYSGGELELPYACDNLTGYHSDILFRTSTDGGATFSPPAKVNDDPPGKDQYYPWMTVTANGTIWAGWHDRREDPNDYRHRWYESYSTDEGATWRKLDGTLGNEPIASVMSLPFSFIGDYAGLGAVGNTVLPMWWDSRIKASGDPFTEVGPPVIFTPTPTHAPTDTRTATPSNATSTATSISTSTPTPTNTTTQSTATSISQSATPATTTTAIATATPTVIAATSTPTVCPITFSDVPVGSTFYIFIRCLACRGIINGYPDGTFKPNNNVTRGQLSKIVSNAAGFHDNQTTQMFEDVPIGSTFFQYIGRLASRGFIGGYPCGGLGEPCVPPANLPYFRPNNNSTRGQISKIVSNAAGFNDTPSGQQFQDVPAGSTYYTYIYRLVSRSIMAGYQCGGTGEPCVPPPNLPYFRPNNNATRGQTSKIVANTFYPSCQTPGGPMK